jgi:hypothetical protein
MRLGGGRCLPRQPEWPVKQSDDRDQSDRDHTRIDREPRFHRFDTGVGRQLERHAIHLGRLLTDPVIIHHRTARAP